MTTHTDNRYPVKNKKEGQFKTTHLRTGISRWSKSRSASITNYVYLRAIVTIPEIVHQLDKNTYKLINICVGLI